MEPQPTERVAPAPAVWETLTDVQKASVRQILIQVCQQVADQWQEETTDEPKRDST
jgi:hypothetical protein